MDERRGLVARGDRPTSSRSPSIRRRGSSPLSSDGHRAQQDGATRRSPRGRSRASRAWASTRGAGRPGPRARSSGCGNRSSCDGSGLCSSSGLEALEQHALVRHVLVDEEHLVVARRHDEGVLELADHRAEAHGAEGAASPRGTGRAAAHPPARRTARPDGPPLQGSGHRAGRRPVAGRASVDSSRRVEARLGLRRRDSSAARPARRRRAPPGRGAARGSAPTPSSDAR